MTLTPPKRQNEENEESPPLSAKYRKSQRYPNRKRSSSDTEIKMPPTQGSHHHHHEDGKSGSQSPLQQGRTRGPGQPLRRGDACLMCRAKKLKCSAHKPVCDQCAKRKDRCVYDAVRPASRVEKLERKLAEMDEQDFREAVARRAAQGLGHFSFDNSGGSLNLPVASTIGQDNGIVHFGAQDLFGFQSPGLPMQTSATNSPNGGDQNLTPKSEQLVDINDIPPAMWAWPNSSGTQAHHAGSSFIPHNQHLHQPQTNGNLPWSVLATSNNVSVGHTNGSPLINGFQDLSIPSTASTSASSSRSQSYDSTACPTPPYFFANSPSIHGLDGLNINLLNGTPPLNQFDWLPTAPVPTSSRLPNFSEMSNQASQNVNQGIDQSEIPSWTTAIPCVTNAEVVNSVMQVKKEMDVEEKIMKARELSEGARDYLLDLFFCPNPPRLEGGSELFSQEEFKARLALPEGQRPHPCLLFSMYTIASSGSYVPSIRKLSEPLFRIAVSKLEIAIRKNDRLIDAINASKNLSKWLFTKSRVLEGYQFSSKAVALSIACGLHRIPSSVFRPEDYLSDLRKPFCVLAPPKNQQEVAERIHCFWSVWGNEKGGTITHGWSSAIRDEEIITPLPRPKEDYSTIALFDDSDITLRDLYDLPHRTTPTQLKSLYCYILVSCHLLHRAMELTTRIPETMVSSYRSLGLSKTNTQYGKVAPRENYPIAYREISETSVWLENNIPTEWNIEFLDGPNWKQPDIPVIALLLKTARMQLHPIHSEIDRPIGLSIAYECSTLSKSLLAYYMRHYHGTSSNSSIRTASAAGGSTPDINGLLDQEMIDGNSGDDENGHDLTPKSIDTSTTFNLINKQPPENKNCTRNQVGISGPYCLSATYWVVQKLVDGSRVLDGLGNEEEARNCISEAQDIVNCCKELAVYCNLVAEHVKRLERLFD